jgi:hypothetical protein
MARQRTRALPAAHTPPTLARQRDDTPSDHPLRRERRRAGQRETGDANRPARPTAFRRRCRSPSPASSPLPLDFAPKIEHGQGRGALA